MVAATLARFLASHWACVTELINGEPTVVTTVPSTGGRLGVHPLVTAVHRVAALGPLHRELLTLGDARIERLRATDRGFVSAGDLAGQRVLLIEDTFTSGARTQSAASALRRGGARSVGVLAVGRVVEPGHCGGCERVWRYATAEPFRFSACCRCTTDRQ
ncbi:ComF family protein [Dactylosporangium sp. CS-047395]|uniref:ComF family protein n=1 Tax=Dactylosporangium sp. CS-047395 TaxID=3239936 RepID=UPI003D94B635